MKRIRICWMLIVWSCLVCSCTSWQTTDRSPERGVTEDLIISRVVILNHVLARDMAQAVSFMLSPDGQIEVIPKPDVETSKTFIIVDRRPYVKSILAVIKEADTPPQEGITHPFPSQEGIRGDESLTTNKKQQTPVPLFEGEETAVQLPPKPPDDFVEDINAPADEAGRRKYVYRVKHSTAKTLKAVLSEMYQKGVYARDEYPPVFVESDADMNALLMAATPMQYAEIRALLEKIDIQPLQTSLDVLIAEVDLTDEEDIGINNTLLGEGPLTLGGETNSVESEFSSSFLEMTGLSEGLSYSIGATGRFMTVLKALLSQRKIRVLSKPRILVRNNTEATINIGEEFPVKQTTTAEGEARTETYVMKDVSLVLKVTPRINPDGSLRLDLNQTVSEVSKPNYGGTGVPSVNKRVAETSLVVQDGMSVFLGGLLSERQERKEYGVPILKDIPLLGRFFRYNETTMRRRELFLLITAHIMWTPDHESVYTKKFEEESQWWLENETLIESDVQKIKRFLRGGKKEKNETPSPTPAPNVVD